MVVTARVVIHLYTLLQAFQSLKTSTALYGEHLNLFDVLCGLDVALGTLLSC